MRRTLAAFLLLACAATAPALAGWWDAAADARPSSLAELRRAPDRWRDVPVLLEVRFGGAGERTNPYFTQFTPELWQPVKLSPRSDADDANLEIATAFVLRGGRDDLRLARISPNLPILVRAVVRDTVAGEPWIEILGMTLDGDPLTPEESTVVREADRFLARRNPVAAERLYRRVLDERKLAERDHADLLRRVGVALHDQRRPREALAAFREALALDPNDLDALHRAEHIESSLARAPLPVAPAPGGAPATAGRAVPSTPESPSPSDAPLLLPGHAGALSPPSGLPTTADDQQPAEQPSAEAPPPTTTTKHPAQKPQGDADGQVPGTSQPGAEDDANDAETDATETTADDVPPPVPARPKLSGPK